ncbi:MAG: DUF1565 domain-containing protein [Tissierellia bacterium]|nr:DUF1565 domain-containing protein [Tissierellia bacterium]
MAWKTPKTTWGQAGQTVPGADDFNRIEGNTQYLKDEIDTRMQVISEIKYYVNASSGNDNNSGTSSAPFRTIQKAVNMAYKALTGQVRIDIAAGIYTEDIEIENMMCPKLFFYGANDSNTIINGYVSINNAQWVRFYRLQIRNGLYGIIALNGLKKLEVGSVIINNVSAIGISAAVTEMVLVEDSSIDAYLTAIDCRNVASLSVRNVEISSVTTQAISITGGVFANTRGLTGNIGSVPVHSVNGSILVRGPSTIIGGADEKDGGGQIFE